MKPDQTESMYAREGSAHREDPVKKCWEDVVLKGGERFAADVRPEILASWQKCRENNLDPYGPNMPPSLSEAQLDKLLAANKKLIDYSGPVIEMIELSSKGTGFIVTLTDKEGFVLLVRGDHEILQMAERNFYLPGCARSNERAGTNAIGMCLVEGKPIQITGAEHYKERHHPWTCSSAPIYDSQGNLIGAITLSGQSIGRHRHTLALITVAAEIIESNLRERALIEEKQRLNSLMTSIFNSISDGVVALDNELVITNLNAAAARMLGLDAETAVGSRLDELVQPDTDLIQAIKDKHHFIGNETRFVCPDGYKTFICRVDPIRNTAGKTLGLTLVITGKRQALSIAQKIGGAYAKYEFSDIKGGNADLLKQVELAKISAQASSRILIMGETGAGKELFAQAIHNFSDRRTQPFVAISCAAIPRDLIESELFGYRGGAFTGARRDGQVGKFELANHGTLFLDEINGLPLDLQSKLLRALQQNEIMRLGDTRSIPIDVRVIAATNTDLFTEVENANFREDLYYRINVVEIAIPPLRERIDDLDLLLEHITNRQSREPGMTRPDISNEALQVMREYHWPGNVRELENCVERAMLIAQGRTIQKIHLPERLWKKPRPEPVGVVALQDGYREMILTALERSGGAVSIAARELGIARSTMYRKMKEFGIQVFTGH